jgi:hypothetical protein
MREQDRIVRTKLVDVITRIGDGDQGPKPTTGGSIGQFKFAVHSALLLGAVLTIVGSETIKLLFRRKLGRNETSYQSTVLIFCVFVGYGLLCIYCPDTFDLPFLQITDVDYNTTYVGLIYILLALTLLLEGLTSQSTARKKTSNIPPDDIGESILFRNLDKKTENRLIIRNVYEPGIFLLVGIMEFPYTYILGAPLIICALSFWISLLIKKKMNFKVYQIEKKDNAIPFTPPNYNSNNTSEYKPPMD